MLLKRIKIDGVAAPADSTDLDGCVKMPVGPLGVAFADAIDLFAATLQTERVVPALTRFGFGDPNSIEVLEEAGLPMQASWGNGEAAACWATEKAVTIQAELAVDPVLFGLFRDHAVRDPRLVTALGQDPVVTIKVGWLFTPDRTTAAITIHELKVGSTGFHMVGAERPRWVPAVAREIGGRFHRVDRSASANVVAARLHEASLATDPEMRAGFWRARAALADSPFGLGQLELVRGDGGIEARFGPQMIPARRFGPAAAEALQLVEAVYVSRPDVLVVEAPGVSQSEPAAVLKWLEAATTGNDATLEQVVLVHGGGA